jgi:hypothetical protein
MYQPMMSEENVKRLYWLKCEKKIPMTRLLDQILNEYFEQSNNQKSKSEDEAKAGGDKVCMSVKSAETHSKSNASRKIRTPMTPDTDIAHSVVSGMTS